MEFVLRTVTPFEIEDGVDVITRIGRVERGDGTIFMDWFEGKNTAPRKWYAWEVHLEDRTATVYRVVVCNTATFGWLADQLGGVNDVNIRNRWCSSLADDELILHHLHEGLSFGWGWRSPLNTKWGGHMHEICKACLRSEHGDCTVDSILPTLVLQVTHVKGEWDYDYDQLCRLDIECRSITDTYRRATLGVYDQPRGCDLAKRLVEEWNATRWISCRVIILDRGGAPLLPYSLVQCI